MRFTHRWAFALLALFAAITPVVAADPLPPALVRAKVINVDEVTKGKMEKAVLEITHVYSGDSALKGQTFRDVYRAEDLRGQAARFPFKVGEEGLWTVKAAGERGLTLVVDRSLPFRQRSQKGNPAHDDHVKLAEVIESVSAAKESDRVKMLIDLTIDPTPQVAVWAVRMIGASDDTAAEKYLDSFAAKPDAKVPLRAQVAMDEVLCKAKREEWFGAKPRVAMLKAWATGKADEGDAYRILNHIDVADQGKEIRNDTACEVIHLAALNKDWPMEVRLYALTVLGKSGERAGDDSAAYNGLFGVIKNGQDSELRQAAAISIDRHIRLHSARRKVVEEYLTTEKDTEVARILRSAIREGIKKDDE